VTTAIITMAGFGRRFAEAGYRVPKYRIVVHGRSLFAWSMLSLRSFIEDGVSFVFVARADDGAADFIRAEAKALGIGSAVVVELSAPTDGQATTAMAAAPGVADKDAPILIYNIDTFVHPSALDAGAVRGDGWIPCFRAEGDAWSFAAADVAGRVSEVREKVRISPHATVGLYWFSSLELYGDVYARHYADPANLEKGERYVAPIYNTLIGDGRPVYIYDVPVASVIPLGVPSDVERFRSEAPPEL
jgi:NDP-sugar pyrophosphorylase family protein